MKSITVSEGPFSQISVPGTGTISVTGIKISWYQYDKCDGFVEMFGSAIRMSLFLASGTRWSPHKSNFLNGLGTSTIHGVVDNWVVVG